MEVTSNGSNTGEEDVKVKEEMEPVSVKVEDDSLKRNAPEDNEENKEEGTPAKRGRGGAVRGSPRGRGRPRGRGAGGDGSGLDKTARIVLTHIDSDGLGDGMGLKDVITPTQTSKRRGRPRGSTRGGSTRGAATIPQQRTKTRGGRVLKPTAKFEMNNEAEEDEENEDIEDDDEEEASLDEEDEEEEEEFVPKKRGRGRGKSPATPGRGRGAGRGRGRGRGKAAAAPKSAENDDDEEEEEEDGEDAEADAVEEANNNDPDAIRTGQYLIDKNDMRRLENYPIWRMEGPNMLRKFEMIVQLGRIRHKSLYAYSSWAQSMKDLYEKIQVTQISSVDGEAVVEIQEEFLPKAPDLAALEEKCGNHVSVPLFTSLLQILFQQAADSNFLVNAYNTNDTNVIQTMNAVDDMVRARITQIENKINMKEDFKTRVRDCPNLKSIRRSNWSQTDQATAEYSAEKGVRSVLLFGFGYDLNTLAEDKSRGAEIASEIVVGATMDQYLAPYHGLNHFKYHLFKRCKDKAKLLRDLEDTEPSLDKLMEDRCWILQAFEDFLKLLSTETLE